MSPGMEGSRSGGLIASTWASMVSLGREGYREHAREIFETAAAMMDVVRCHPELRIMGEDHGAPTFCFSFTSDDFEIYHLVDFLGPQGWRFNGQQYPNAIHMAVTRPQTRAGRGRAVRRRPGRRGRLREGEARGRRGGLRRRDLRRRRRRARPGDVSDFIVAGDGRHARQAAVPATGMTDLVTSSSPSTSAPAAPRSASSPLRGEVRLVGAHAGADARRPRRRARPRTPSEWWRVIARVRTPRWRRRRRRLAGRRRLRHRPVGQHRARSTSAGRPVGPCVLWSDTRGAPYSRTVVGGPVSGLRAQAAGHLAAPQRRHPDARRAPTRSATCSTSQHEQPDVAARARWFLEPVDYLTMRFTGVPAASHASMTGAWLTDNRSLTTLAYDDVLVRLAGVDASRLPPLVRDRVGRRPGAARGRRRPRHPGRRPSP